MGVAALVLGIIGLIISIIPGVGAYGLPLDVLALLLGAFGMRKVPRGLATAGLVLGLVGTALGAFWAWSLHKAHDALQDAIDHPSEIQK